MKNDEIKVCVSNKSIEDGILKKRLNSTKEFEIKATPTIYINGKKYNVTRKEHVEGDLVVFMQDQNGAKSNMLQSELNEKLQEQKEYLYI